MKQTAKIALSVCRKYPETPTLTLAKKIFKDNPEVYTTLDHARTTIRDIRGACGASKRKYAKVPRECQKPHNPLKLPEPVMEDFTPFLLDECKALVISDVHLPYHDLPALTAALKDGKKEKCDTLIINGDLFDFYQLSRFLKDPRQRSFADEIIAGKEFFKVVQKMFQRVIWKYGNHDERYGHYLILKAPELLDVPGMSLPELLGLSGVEIVDRKRPIYAGDLTILHGHELQGGFVAPVNVARGLFLRAKACALQGHNHQSSEHSEVDVRRKLVTTWSTGCLCYLYPEYARFNKWNHGHAILTLDKDGGFAIKNKRILGGRVL